MPHRADSASPLLEITDLHTTFPVRSQWLRRVTGHIQAVAGVSLSIRPGETLGLVGESGSGKSTLARTVIGLEQPAQGSIQFDGTDLVSVRGRAAMDVRRDVQMIFQDPYSSLNPWRTIFQLLSEPWLVHRELVPRRNWRTEAAYLLERVGLAADHLDRFPHQFSGGQRQRISIARALAMRPKLIVCDEAVSALDVSVQAQVLNLLRDLQDEFELTYLFISHDLSVVRHVSDRIAVMYLGRIVEVGGRDEVFNSPAHPYTKALLSAVPSPDPWAMEKPERIMLEGDVPSPSSPPSGCRFRTRCWKAQDICSTDEPPLALVAPDGGRRAACHFPETGT